MTTAMATQGRFADVATAESEKLRALARRVADALPPEAVEVVLTGSTARGSADEHSDVELLVVAEELPESLPLHDLDTWSPDVEGAHWFGGWFEGEYVELVWWTPAYAEERVRAVAAGEIVDHERLRAAEAIVHGIPLRGRRHADWRARLAHYPPGLATAVVDDVADTWIEPLGSQRSLLRDGDALVLARRLTEDAERILRVVFALNEEWEPGWKRLAERVEPLVVKPDHLAERIDTAIRTFDLQAMRALAAETLAHAPETDKTGRARKLLVEPL
jgi:predicted nucleotidyltransferase